MPVLLRPQPWLSRNSLHAVMRLLACCHVPLRHWSSFALRWAAWHGVAPWLLCHNRASFGVSFCDASALTMYLQAPPRLRRSRRAADPVTRSAHSILTTLSTETPHSGLVLSAHCPPAQCVVSPTISNGAWIPTGPLQHGRSHSSFRTLTRSGTHWSVSRAGGLSSTFELEHAP